MASPEVDSGASRRETSDITRITGYEAAAAVAYLVIVLAGEAILRPTLASNSARYFARGQLLAGYAVDNAAVFAGLAVYGVLVPWTKLRLVLFDSSEPVAPRLILFFR